MTVTNATVGALTDTSARVATKVSSTSNVRLAVSTAPNFANPTFFGPVTPDATTLRCFVQATGLQPNTRYWWQLEHGGVLDTTYTGKFRTAPTAGSAASFTVAVAGDAGQTPDYPGEGAVLASTRMSNHPVFDRIREADPLLFCH